MSMQERARLLASHCRAYKGAETKRSLWQLITTGGLFFLALGVMLAALRQESYWLYAALVLPTAGLLVRLFIIQHDCGHGSFFKSRIANDMTGRLISLLTFTPYDLWRKAHNVHHAGSGNLNRRGAGAIDTLTVKEYKALAPRARFFYRFYRHPMVLLVLGPPIYILLLQRFAPMQSVPFLKDYHPIPARQAWKSVMALNFSLLVLYGGLMAFLGWKTIVLLYLPVLLVAFWAGQWLFFVQHQFEDSYWAPNDQWHFSKAAVEGSSYYALPAVLQWFTGNIGFHHIHHLCTGIPNYRLQECFDANKELPPASKITFAQSLKGMHLSLWDENLGKMVGFRDLKSP